MSLLKLYNRNRRKDDRLLSNELLTNDGRHSKVRAKRKMLIVLRTTAVFMETEVYSEVEF